MKHACWDKGCGLLPLNSRGDPPPVKNAPPLCANSLQVQLKMYSISFSKLFGINYTQDSLFLFMSSCRTTFEMRWVCYMLISIIRFDLKSVNNYICWNIINLFSQPFFGIDERFLAKVQRHALLVFHRLRKRNSMQSRWIGGLNRHIQISNLFWQNKTSLSNRATCEELHGVITLQLGN